MMSEINKSGRVPLGHSVLVRPYELQRPGGVIVMPDTVKDRTVLMEDRAVIIEVGSECWKDERTPRALPGDHVLIAKFAGYILEGDDGVMYRLVNSRDVFCRIASPQQEKAHG
jgi:co-chaperonin GroES (HSP10)